jgi:hypothetical protein
MTKKDRQITMRNWFPAANVDGYQEKGVIAYKDCPGSGAVGSLGTIDTGLV